MVEIILVSEPLINFFLDVPAIIGYSVLAMIFFRMYHIHRHGGFLSIGMGFIFFVIYHSLRLVFFLFLDNPSSFFSLIIVRFLLLSWGMSFMLFLHGLAQFRYERMEKYLFVLYLFSGFYFGLTMFFPEIQVNAYANSAKQTMVIPFIIVALIFIIHLAFVYEILAISLKIKNSTYHQQAGKTALILHSSVVLLSVWLVVLFQNLKSELVLIEPVIAFLGFSLWSIAMYKYTNFLLYPKYIPHIILVSRSDGRLVYTNDFFCISKKEHNDQMANMSLVSGLFVSLKMASSELFGQDKEQDEEIVSYDMGKNTAIIYEHQDFVFTLLVENHVFLYTPLLKDFAKMSCGRLSELKGLETINLDQPVQKIFGLEANVVNFLTH